MSTNRSELTRSITRGPSLIPLAILGAAAVLAGCHGPEESSGLRVFQGEPQFLGPCQGKSLKKFIPTDGAPGDLFGFSVSVSGDVALVGANEDDDRGPSSGSAYLFVRSGSGGWNPLQKLTANDGTAGQRFGTGVSVSGDLALVGAYQDNARGISAGSAYLFARTGGSVWNQVQKLTAYSGKEYDYLGYSVALSGTLALVGARGDDDRADWAGAAYMFARTGSVWSQQQKFTANDGAKKDYFGASVSVNGDIALVGAHQDDDRGMDSGSGYVFSLTAGVWSQVQKLTASNGAWDDHFGYAVSVNGDVALLGAHAADSAGKNAGSAYVFARTGGNTWSQQQWLTAKDAATGDLFGFSVSVSGDQALLGSRWDDDRGGSSGSAYLFARTGSSWKQKLKYTAGDGSVGDELGYGASLSGEAVVLGARQNDDKGSNSGVGVPDQHRLPEAQGFGMHLGQDMPQRILHGWGVLQQRVRWRNPGLPGLQRPARGPCKWHLRAGQGGRHLPVLIRRV